MYKQQEVVLADEAKHVEPFRADRPELLVLVVYPIEQFPEVLEMQVNPEGTHWDTYFGCQGFSRDRSLMNYFRPLGGAAP